MTHPEIPTSPVSPPGFDADHFSLLGLPQRFDIDLHQLDTAWRSMQARVHPDRHAAGTSAERRVAMQWASRLNEAYRVLRQPLTRARYLCELAGYDVQAESNTAMPAEFLMQQMEWREALSLARENQDAQALGLLEEELQTVRTALVDRLRQHLAGPTRNYPKAVQCVREWMFLERLADEIEEARD